MDSRVIDFVHAHLVRDWLLRMMMSFRVGVAVSVWSGDKDVGRALFGGSL